MPNREGSHLPELISQAIDSLSGARHVVREATQHVPDKPGLYAVYADAASWSDLGLAPHQAPLYVGKAEDSLVSRDLRTHFSSGRTGSSTVRRSFAALLRESLDLRGVPRNMARPERPANFGLEPEADRRLTEWMRDRLELAVWVKSSTTVPLTEIEAGVISHWQPPLNIDKVDRPLPALRRARQTMADDARAWARARGFAL